jgi:hypothetical protein
VGPKIAVCLVVASLSATAVADESYDVIKTRDGKVHAGKILRETERGYLFSENDSTDVIQFTEVADIQKSQPTAPTGPRILTPAPARAEPITLVDYTTRKRELVTKLDLLKDERAHMASGIISICLLTTGLGTFLFLSMAIGAGLMVAALPVGIFWGVEASSLSGQIRETKAEIERLGPQPAPPLPVSVFSGAKPVLALSF